MRPRRAAIAAATMAAVGIVTAGVIVSGVNAVANPSPVALTTHSNTTGGDPTHQIQGITTPRHRPGVIVDQLGWSSTYEAEFVTFSQLQVDAFLTLDEDLASSLDDVDLAEWVLSPHDGASGRGPRE